MPTEHPVTAPNVAAEAIALIGGDRQDDYGDMRASFDKISGMWSAYLGRAVTALDVCNLMVLLKVARASHRYHRDSYVDMAGYALCAERLQRSYES